MASTDMTIMDMPALSFSDAPSVAYQVVYTLRVEITFVAGFVFFYLTGLLNFKRAATSKDIKGRQSFPKVQNRLPPGSKAQPASATTKPETRSISDKDVGALLEKTPDANRLKDAEWLIPKLVQLCQSHCQRSASIFRTALQAGLDLGKVSADERDQLLSALVVSQIRVGIVDDVLLRFLRDLKAYKITVSEALHVSIVKLCTAKHHFSECLALHDLIADCHGSKASDRNLWSCLLFCATEAKAYQRCGLLFKELEKSGGATEKDYWNMFRVCSRQGDAKMTLQLLQKMRADGVVITNVVYNTALATCVACQLIDEARKLLDEMNTFENVTDVITYNTIMKGYANLGLMDDCFHVYEMLVERGIEASQVTYGILLDGCINNKQVDRAAKVFDIITEKGCPMNTVLYTTLVKGFAREGKVDEAMRIYEHMCNDKSAAADVITFSLLLKVNCDADRLEKALELLDGMVKSGLKPDEVIYNNILAGCSKQANTKLAKRLYNDMISSGIKPSNATFSILIRLYSSSKSLDEAVEMLTTEPQRHNVKLEPRLFSQLIQCCIRARQGRRAVEVFEMMAKQGGSSPATNATTLSMCVKLNMLDTAVEILEKAAEHRCRVDSKDAYMLLESLCKKRKSILADACAVAMKALNIPVEPVMR